MVKQVSEIDINHLEIIRVGVKQIIQKSAQLDSSEVKVLDIAPQDHNGAKEFFKQARIFTLDIDKESGADYIADLCENNSNLILSNSFDIVICTEVLEHTLNPFDAVSEIYRILKPNGKVFVSTPFNFRIHGPLPDCWRFTEHGLRAMFKNYSSIEISEIEDINRFLMPIQYHTIATK
jgi:SAM-dependent methyltransferase